MSNIPRPQLAIQNVPSLCSASNQERDDDGVIDPALDGLLNIGAAETSTEDTDDASNLETGDCITSVRQLGTDDGAAEPDLDTGCLLDEPATTPSDEDLDGPVADELVLPPEPESATCHADADETNVAFGEDISNETLPALNWEEESIDDAPVENVSENISDSNDIAITWASQAWSEQKLRTAYVPRKCLIARRNILLAAGDAIDILSLDDLSAIDPSPPPWKARYACFLDGSCKTVLVVKSTGQIVIWNRETSELDPLACELFKPLDRVADIWIEPAGDKIWVRLETGQLLRGTRKLGSFDLVPLPGRCVAMGGNDEALFCLVSQSNVLTLLAVREDKFDIRSVQVELAGLAFERDTFLVTLSHVILIGARGHGLWLSTDSGASFRKVSGCRDVTAFTLGNFSGRIYAWAALFFELDDRAELVGIDLRTSRVQKLAEYYVMTDSVGPEDDPPERARIDCLLWDFARQRMLAAGCFGLACFAPSQSTNPAS